MRKDQADMQTDLARLKQLARRYEQAEGDLRAQSDAFERAQDQRKAKRLTLGDVFSQLSGQNLDENKANEITFEEAEELCKMIDEKDRLLFKDLMQIQDQLN